MPFIGEKDKGAPGASTYKNMTQWEQDRIFRSTLGGSNIRPLLDTIQDGSIYRKPVQITAAGGVSAKTVAWEMTPLRVEPDAHVEVSSVDGWVNKTIASGNVWVVARDGAGSGANDSGVEMNVVIKTHADNNEWTEIKRSIILFDTSNLVAGAKIVKAQITVMVTSASTAEFGGSIVVCAALPATNTALVTADYGTLGETDYSDRLSVTSFNAAGVVRIFTLNDEGIGALNAGGITKFGLRNSYDIDDDPPTWVGSKSDTVNLSTAENTTYSTPLLEVTYLT